MARTPYSAGTAAVSNGGTTVTITGGVLTALNCRKGYDVIIEGVANYVDERTDTETFKLLLPHEGAGGSGLNYAIRPITDEEIATAELNARVAELISLMENTYGLTVSMIDGVPAIANDITARGAFDDEDAGTVVLVADSTGDGDGRAAFYVMGDGGSGDWSDPIYLTGIEGPAGTGDRFDLAIYASGQPNEDEVILRHVFSDTGVTFPSGLADSRAVAVVAAEAEAVFTIEKNGSEVGTVTFAAESDVGVFSFVDPETFGAGDVLAITAPSSRDPALSGVSITLAGYRS